MERGEGKEGGVGAVRDEEFNAWSAEENKEPVGSTMT